MSETQREMQTYAEAMPVLTTEEYAEQQQVLRSLDEQAFDDLYAELDCQAEQPDWLDEQDAGFEVESNDMPW